ncbi:hypothetical protein AYI70_g10929 [Smittium culicis]|uniref:Uncharacterized protein n=1 Tax=Smittium culicis TaxID=133412 RepID=A0A1R1X496_9FUNG|nr:hypothetical protein AYI70_g10929 [Smittium culicis]
MDHLKEFRGEERSRFQQAGEEVSVYIYWGAVYICNSWGVVFAETVAGDKVRGERHDSKDEQRDVAGD